MSLIYVEIIGWLGMLCILLAYWLVSIQKIKPDSKSAQFLNLFGAIFVIINVGYHMAIPSVVLNTIWAVIALVGLFKKH